MFYHHPVQRHNPSSRTPQHDSSQYIKRSDFLLAEYNTLRTEILQRISTRYQLISITLTVFGAVFAIANPYLAVLYPVLAIVMLFFYSTNADAIREASEYICKHLETQVTEDGKHPLPTTKQAGDKTIYQFGWQTYRVFEQHERTRALGNLLVGRLVFPITSTLAWIVGITLDASKATHVPMGLNIFSLIIIIFSFILALVWKNWRNIILRVFGAQPLNEKQS